MVPFGNGFFDRRTSPLTFSDGVQADAASYIIFQQGAIIKAQNGSTKNIDYQGTDAATVINSVMAFIEQTGGLIYVKGYTTPYDITATIVIPSNTFFFLEPNAVFKANASLIGTANMFTNFTPVGTNTNIIFQGGIIDGNQANRSGKIVGD